MLEQVKKSCTQIIINEIYTEEKSGVVNIEQDVTGTVDLENGINIADLIDCLSGQDGSVRTLLTKGGVGIGKTVLTQKFALDWAEDKVNIDTYFTFPFSFRELNLLREKKYSWEELLCHFFADTKEAGIASFDKLQIVFILDGLDECRLPLDFRNNEILTLPTQLQWT